MMNIAPILIDLPKAGHFVRGFTFPKIFDPIAIERMRASFHEILDALEEQYERPLSVGEDRLKAAIISRLLTLAADGTPQRDWKSKVLSTLPLQ
jgi:hypothetical protein